MVHIYITRGYIRYIPTMPLFSIQGTEAFNGRLMLRSVTRQASPKDEEMATGVHIQKTHIYIYTVYMHT